MDNDMNPLRLLEELAPPEIYTYVADEVNQRRILDMENLDEVDEWHMDLIDNRLGWIGLIDYLNLTPSDKVTPGVKAIIEAIPDQDVTTIRTVVKEELVIARSARWAAAIAYQNLDTITRPPSDMPMAHLVVQVLSLIAIKDSEATKVVLTEIFEGDEANIDYNRTSALVAIATKPLESLVAITTEQQDLLQRVINIAILINKYVSTTYGDTTTQDNVAHIYITLFNEVVSQHKDTIDKIIVDGAKVSTLEERLG